MNLSCLFHRWVAGKNAFEDGSLGPASFQRHADSCPRCAAHSQRLRSLDSRFRSLTETGETDLPDGLHSKIMASVRQIHLENVYAANEADSTSSKSRRGVVFAFCGVAAAITLTLFALNHDSTPNITPGSGVASSDPTAPEIAAVPIPALPVPVPVPVPEIEDPDGSPIESIAKNEGSKNFLPTATRRVTEFTGELPAFLVAKVSGPYESEMGHLADDLKSAGNFLSHCLFVPEVLENSGL